MTQILERNESIAPARRAVLDVSIVIVTWQSEEWIERCLASIPAAVNGHSYEVIVHDNASNDRTVAVAEQNATTLLESESNVGFAGGVNRALQTATGRYIVLLNPDCEPTSGSISTLIDFLDNSGAAAAVPLLIGLDGKPQTDFQLRRLPTMRSIAAELLLLNHALPRNGAASHAHYRDVSFDLPQVVEQPAAAAMVLRRSVMNEIGGLDERFTPAWFEDVDYCRRMAKGGHEIYLVPTAVVIHRGGSSLEHVSYETFSLIWYRNLYRYARKWFRPASAEVVRWLTVTGMLLRIAALGVGFRRAPLTRREAFTAFRRVLREALLGWEDGSQRY